MTRETTIIARSKYEEIKARGGKTSGYLVIEDQQPPEMLELIRRSKMNTYMSWLDEPCPELGFATPREVASESAEGIAAVELLIGDMEEWDAQMPEEQHFDFSVVRRELGIGLVGRFNVYGSNYVAGD